MCKVHQAGVLSNFWIGALFCLTMSSATRAVPIDHSPCPPDKLNCQDGADIGLVTFESEDYTTLEHAREFRYKDLVCKPQNFCSIQWLKDGIPYPWGWSHDELESMGVTQTAFNTTLEFRRVGREAAGVFTCHVTGANGTTISRNVELRIQATSKPAPPIPVAGSLCANQTAELGSNATFSCDIFVGEDQLTFSLAYWMIEVEPDQWEFADFANIPGTEIKMTSGAKAGDREYITSTLQIDNVTAQTYARYKLYASNGMRNSVTDFVLRAVPGLLQLHVF